MRKDTKRICYLLLLIVICLGTLCACDKDKYNAVLYDNVGEYINEDYMREDLVFNDDYTAKDKCFIVATQEEFDQIFTGFYVDVDFDKQMILLKADGCCTTAHEYKIAKFTVKDNRIDCRYKIVGCSETEDCACRPYIRYMVVLMDKTDIEDFDIFK